MSFFWVLEATDTKAWNEASLFFAQSVFGILGTYLLVPKVRSWCEMPDLPDAVKLLDDIGKKGVEAKEQAEAMEADGDEAMARRKLKRKEAKGYEQLQTDAKSTKTAMERWGRFIVIGIPVLCCLCELCDIYLLASGKCYKWGWWTVLLLVPIPVGYVVSQVVCWYYEESLKDYRRAMQKIKEENSWLNEDEKVAQETLDGVQ